MKRTGKAWIVTGAVMVIVSSSSCVLAGTFDSWDFSMKITFSGYDKPEPLTNFPMLVVLSTNIDGFSYSGFESAGGDDLRFAGSDATTELNYEIEKWDTNSSSYVWVQVPELASTNDFIYAYWGMSTNAPAYTTNGATWSNAYAAVWHLAETNLTDETTGGTNRDATANLNHGIQYRNSPTNGMIAGAQSFDGSNDYIDCNISASLDIDSPRTISAWIYPFVLKALVGVVAKNQNRAAQYSYMMCCHTNGTLAAYPSGATWYYSDNAGISSNNWYHVVFETKGDGKIYFYVNGQSYGSDTFPDNNVGGDSVYIGSWIAAQPIRDFDGIIDEVRMSSVARGSNWTWACWMNQASNNVFIDYGTVPTNLMVDTLPVSNIGVTNATLNGQLGYIGGAENPQVYFCRDYTDKGTTSTGDWGNVDYMGTNWGKGEAFSTNLTSLLSGSNYYFRCYVTNSTGEDWSDDAKSFTTIYLPSVTNTGATNVFRQVATLRGEITDTGGDTPYVWFYYWIDGDSTQTVAKGLQDGAFSSEETELTMGTNYTYQILASNMAGTVWSGEKSFATLPFGTGTNTWTGEGVTDDWFEHANWSADDIPMTGEHVIITNVANSPRLTNSTVVLASFTITNETLTFTNWITTLTASNVMIQSGGTLTLPAAFTDTQMSNRVHIACTNLTLADGGMIDANGKGYGAATGPGKGVSGGKSGGGGYGGEGGDGLDYAGGSTYGSASAPLSPGSGGGNQTGIYPGGRGGGAVSIEATGNVTVNGTIRANGSNAAGYAGGGSGGSIYITCQMFEGGANGILSACGGNENPSYEGEGGGGGGGGRIAVIYQSLGAQHSVQFSVLHGSGYYSTPGDDRGAHVGTLYFPNTNILSEVLQNETLQNISGEFVVPGFTNWSPSALVVSNVTVSFGDEFPLNIAGDLLVAGTDSGLVCGSNSQLTCGGNITLNSGDLGMRCDSQLTCDGNMTVSNGNFALWERVAMACAGNMTLDSGIFYIMEHATMSCGGYLTMTNAGELYVYSGATNVIGPDYGVLVTVTGDMVMASSTWIYPYSLTTDGGSPLFRMNNLVISTNAGFDAKGKGYDDAQGPGEGESGNKAGGAGYGGKGGNGQTCAGGSTYGSTNAPILPGSGGGRYTSIYKGGKGGGLVRIEAEGSVAVNGTIKADGNNGSASAGGGSGGGIFITCGGMSGGTDGLLQANGGNGGSNGGGGGGGRIAVWYAVPESERQRILDGDMQRVSIITNASDYSDFSGTVSVTNGTGYTNLPPVGAECGTIVFLTVTPPSGTVFMCQ